MLLFKELQGMYTFHNLTSFVQSSFKELLSSVPLLFVVMWSGGKILDLNPTDWIQLLYHGICVTFDKWINFPGLLFLSATRNGRNHSVWFTFSVTMSSYMALFNFILIFSLFLNL